MKKNLIILALWGMILPCFSSNVDSTIQQQNGVNTIKERYFYTANKLDSLISYQWDGSIWSPSSKERYVYSNNKIVEKTLDSWSSGWSTFSKTIIDSVNINGKYIDIENDYIWSNNSWIQSIKTELANGNELIASQYNGSSWIAKSKTQVSFTSSSYQEIESEYNNSAWELMQKTTKTVDNSLTQEETEYAWDGSNWIAARKLNYFYTSNRLDSIITSEYDGIEAKWFYESKKEYNYNQSGDLATLKGYSALSSSEWELVSVETSYYKSTSSEILKNTVNSFNIGYCPFDNTLTIHSIDSKPIKVSILNLNGVRVGDMLTYTNSRTKLEALPKGVLIIKTDVATKQIIVK